MSGPTDEPSTGDTLLRTADDVSVPRPSLSSDLAPGALIGRYVVLSKLGAGAMGVVYLAHDPELDRKVALKLLRFRDRDTAGSRGDRGARLLREARGLAKLSHPNVVSIHDVGMHDDNVYLAMEWVEGTTLTEWQDARPRRWPETVPILRAVGLGLAAAHAKGLLHRDIKPDNVMVGQDGRVRLMDFGLVRGEREESADPNLASSSLSNLPVHVTRAGSLLGTPAYMAPEQLRGDPLEPAADQFAFCVMAWQALYGERPFAGENVIELAANVLDAKIRSPRAGTGVPGWLQAVLRRGLEVDPMRRWASLPELLAALDRGQARARRRIGLGIAACVALVAAGGEGLRRSQLAGRVAACEAAGGEVDGVWNDSARASIRTALIATQVAAADVTVDKVMPWLDQQAEAWRSARHDACVASTIEQAWDDGTRDKALWCLEDRLLELAMLVEGLENPDVMTVHHAVYQANSLSPPARCVEPELLATMPTLPPEEAREQARTIRADLARAAARRSGGEHEEELALVRASLVRSEALGYRPLIAAAQALEGKLSFASGHPADAEPLLIRAYFDAVQADAWEIAADAAIELSFVVGERLVRPAEGKNWNRHGEIALAHGGDPLALEDALRLNYLALIDQASGEEVEARRLHERVLEIRERELGGEHPDIAATLTNLANLHNVRGEFAEAERLYERALSIRENALGSAHPDVANSIGSLAGAFYNAGDYVQAELLYNRALGIQEKSLGSDHPHLAATIANLGNLHSSRGEYEQAKARFARALEIQEKSLGRNHPNIATVLNNLGRAMWKNGDYAEARPLLERALSLREKAFGPDHPHVATTLTNLGLLDISELDLKGAQPLLERALAIREKAGPEHPFLAYTLDGMATLALARNRPLEAIAHADRAVRVREQGNAGPVLIAASQFLLAQALANAPEGGGRDLKRSLELAEQAREGMRLGPADERQQIEEWLAARLR